MWRITLLVALVATTINPQAHAQSDGSTDSEITGLKKQIRLLEEKLDKIQKRTDARIAAIATAPARPSAPNSSAAPPVKDPAGLPEAVVLMPNNRPTICTVDQQSCVAGCQYELGLGGCYLPIWGCYAQVASCQGSAQCYLDADCNIGRAANLLFVHYKTMRNRLQRIEELTNMELDRQADRFNAQLALKILRLTSPRDLDPELPTA